MKRIGFFAVCMLMGITFAFAQENAEIKFSETVHDFGTIYEEDGEATCEFFITNTGKTPLEITDAKASCGCTKPSFTKEPIAPEKTGYVKATYLAKGRPGPFSKTISIYTNVQEAPFTVSIKGEVVSKASSVDVQLKQEPVSIEPTKVLNKKQPEKIKVVPPKKKK